MADPTKDKVIAGRKCVRVMADAGYSPHVNGKALLKVKDTGNGLIAKFPAHASMEQDYYLCMDYAQASYLWLALSKHFGGRKEPTNG